MRALAYLLGGDRAAHGGGHPHEQHLRSVEVILTLSRSVYCAGDFVHGTVELISPPAAATSGLLSLDVVLHGHLRAEPRWLNLTEPIRAACGQGGEPPTGRGGTPLLPPFDDVSGENVACIFATPATPAAVRMLVPAGTPRWRRAFVVRLPTDLLPSFRGFGAKIFYVASVSARYVGTSAPTRGSCELHLPFSVMAAGGGREVTKQAVAESTVHMAPANAVLMPPSALSSVGVAGWNLHNRAVYAPELEADAGAEPGPGPAGDLLGPTVFSIRNGSHHIGCLVLHKQRYCPGDVVLGTFDLTGGTVHCYQIAVALVTREAYQDVSGGGAGTGRERGSGDTTDGSLGTYDSVLDTHHEYTVNCVQTSFMLRVPIDAQPGFDCGVVSLAWLLRFEFTTSKSSLAGEARAGSAIAASAAAPTATASETSLLKWTTTLDVVPPNNVMAPGLGGGGGVGVDGAAEPPPDALATARADSGRHMKRALLEIG